MTLRPDPKYPARLNELSGILYMPGRRQMRKFTSSAAMYKYTVRLTAHSDHSRNW
jgi:hypothetical protein